MKNDNPFPPGLKRIKPPPAPPLPPLQRTATEYVQVQDEDSHRYVIPFEKVNEWNAWRDLSDEDAQLRETPPAWATRLDKGYLIFRGWRIGWQYEG